MPKKKKTREQKIAAEQRRQKRSEEPVTTSPVHTTYTLPSVNPSAAQKPTSRPAHVATTDYRYLSHDLFKTALVTLSVVVIELLLRFFTNGV